MTLCHTRNVDLVACGEGIDCNDIAHVVAGAVIEAELLEVLLNAELVLFEMTFLSLGCLLRLRIHETKLNGVIAVVFGGLLLSDHAGTSFHDGHGNHVSVLVKDLCHTDFLTDNALFHLLFSSCKLLVGCRHAAAVNMTYKVAEPEKSSLGCCLCCACDRRLVEIVPVFLRRRSRRCNRVPVLRSESGA